MRVLPSLCLTVGLAACSGSARKAPPEPAAVEGTREAVSSRQPGLLEGHELRFVKETRINLTDAPGGDTLGRLTINSPLGVIRTSGDAVKVRVGNGKEGWVDGFSIASTPLTVAVALKSAEAAATADERLAWAQRASAIDPHHRGALRALANAYRETDLLAVAKRVEKKLTYPADIRVAGAGSRRSDGTLGLEWGQVEWTTPPKVRGLSANEMSALGVQRGQALWVLPTRGAAVRATVTGMRLELFNRCAGTYGHTLLVDAPIADDAVPIAYTFSTPPSAWRDAEPQRDLETAIASVGGGAEPGPAGPWYEAVATGDGVRVEVTHQQGVDERGSRSLETVRWEVDHRGGVRQVDAWKHSSFADWTHNLVGRDVSGDGRIELVTGGSCSMSIDDDQGVSQAQASPRCCGC